jgi:hypothetical protein
VLVAQLLCCIVACVDHQTETTWLYCDGM